MKCIFCHNDFRPKRSNQKPKYCSRICYLNNIKPQRQEKICLNCNLSFTPSVYQTKSSHVYNLHQKFCSQSCSASYNNTGWQRNQKHFPKKIIDKSRICSLCKNEFLYTNGNQKYCSTKCRKIIANEKWHRYNTQKKNQTPVNADIQKIQIIYLNCPSGYQIDHIIPISKGGLHHQDNLQYLTEKQNKQKSNKLNWHEPSDSN